ncbi:hypothetical protein BLNAU_10539 [Blattamonas nauphoetae]|uniref:Uncharacterized protein n=1 Tax=Blattamonas nauphoetae TaxID=2049346 RepID=A0ABQ9XSR3_9EUKA|nr:hypothetical protein BLNAU_10539 [Blattamonas nauphoetae]
MEQSAGHEPLGTGIETGKNKPTFRTFSDVFLTSLFMCDRCWLRRHIMVSFAGTIGILSRQSPSMVATHAQFIVVLDPCLVAIHTLPLPSASP